MQNRKFCFSEKAAFEHGQRGTTSVKQSFSIKDIAKEAGVSAATVSRVINKNGRYSPETEQKVLEIIRNRQYVPNQIAKGLREQRTMNVGIVVPDITNEFFVKLVSEIDKNLFAHGYQSLLCNTDEDDEQERKRIQMMYNQNVCGLIFLSSGSTQEESGRDLPAIYIDRIPEHPKKNAFMLSSDNVQGGNLAAQELLDCGCKNILARTSRRRVSAYTERLEGFEQVLSAQDPPKARLNVEYLDRLHYQEAYDAVTELVRQGHFDYDGVFAASDWLALGCYQALTDQGIRVPEQTKIIGYDDISITAFNSVPISTVHQQVDVLGEKAVEQLLAALDGKEDPEQMVTHVPVYLMPRTSTRGRNAHV